MVPKVRLSVCPPTFDLLGRLGNYKYLREIQNLREYDPNLVKEIVPSSIILNIIRQQFL
jgi:hypothetical protein